MFAPSKINSGARAVALALTLATSSFSAHAVLERAGPVSIAPSIGGFPAWYQDTTGLAVQFCDPKNAAEVTGGWCLLLPPVSAPETFPTNFFIEHFYWAGTAVMAHTGGAHSIVVLALEASFANGSQVLPGDQMTFARIRIKLDPAPVAGTYRFIHPYGEESHTVAAGDRIFFTADAGLGCGLDFTCALNGALGPFLLPSATPGGAEMAALTAANPTPDTNPANFGGAFAPTAYPGTGDAYIADPARIGPVTGSSLPNFTDSTGASRNHNIFRIEGPPGSALGVDPVTGLVVDWAETTNFSLAGRVYTGVMPGRVAVDRASYSRNPTQKLDVFATAIETTAGRVPTAPRPAAVASTLTFFNAPCAGFVDALGTIQPPFSAPIGAQETPMRAAGALQWAQSQPAVVPSMVCVKDASARDAAGNLIAVYVPHIVTDEVTVTPAFYDPSVGTLTVGATSSDTVLAPTLTLAYGTFLGDLVGGQIVVPALLAPPASVFVQSSALGITKYNVSTGFVGGAVAAMPVATNDSFTFLMNSPPQVLSILANDTNAAGGTVTLTSAPTRGTAVVNANGTVTFTPTLNASGADAFTYTVTVGTQVSNVGIVNLNITPVNLAPVAANDAYNAIANKVRTFNVLANDTDPNGAADIVAAVSVSQPTPAGATTSVAGGIVTFNATAAGTYTYTYRAQDVAGLVSANVATATVTVSATESISYTKNQYTRSQSKLVVTGTVGPVADQSVTLDFVNAAGVVVGTAGSVLANSTGVWSFAIVGIALPAGTISVKATTSNGTVLATALTII